ncbi:MAG: alpha/beta hydrolase [Roseicyclus sp.]
MIARITMAVAALTAIAAGLYLLELPRAGLEIEHVRAGNTPVTIMQRPEAEGPLVVIAHGFAGSRQLMAAWQLTLAQAGYVTASFDFEGHGRNPVPMSGDVTSVDGTTRLLMDEMERVTDAALDVTNAQDRVALLGHSMASDIVVRQGIRDDRVEAIVGVSLFSQAVTEEEPENLLIINGSWEAMLREAARDVMAPLGAAEGETAGAQGEGFARRAVAAPFVEHVGVLYAPTGLEEARDWLDASFERPPAQTPLATIGPAILLMLFGIVLLARVLAAALPEGPDAAHVTARRFWILAAVPAVATPLLLAPFDTRFLPVLVADYLALHLAVYGALQLAAILPGAILAMLADAVLLEAGRARLWRRWAARALFLGSLGLAVTLDFERLFFLLIILPVILLFYLSFGLMGGWVGRRTGSVAAMGLGLGIILGWSLGVTFPLFDPGV